jgi:hypothetical protein
VFPLNSRRRPPAADLHPAPAVDPAAQLQERIDRAHLMIQAGLDAQSALFAEDRNDELVDALLDLRRALRPPMIRAAVPVVPGRSS